MILLASLVLLLVGGAVGFAAGRAGAPRSSDLGIDPGKTGCQHYEASQLMFYQRRIDPSAVLVLWQAGIAGDRSFRRFSTEPAYRQLLVDLLADDELGRTRELPARPLASAMCRLSNSRAAASARSPPGDRLMSPATSAKPM